MVPADPSHTHSNGQKTMLAGTQRKLNISCFIFQPTSMYDTRSRNSRSWQDSMSANISWTARGIRPASSGVPRMV